MSVAENVTVTGMTDHYLKARELLDEVDCLQAELDVEYSKPIKDNRAVASRHERIRSALSRAKIHAQLAEVQALHDMHLVRTS